MSKIKVRDLKAGQRVFECERGKCFELEVLEDPRSVGGFVDSKDNWCNRWEANVRIVGHQYRTEFTVKQTDGAEFYGSQLYDSPVYDSMSVLP